MITLLQNVIIFPDVCGPDEYHNSVNNSVYINVGIKIVMEAAANLTLYQMRKLFNVNLTLDRPTNKYQHYADNIYILDDPEEHYHPEYDGYMKGL